MIGVSEIAFFHSTPEELDEHMSYLPFPCFADPTKGLYRKFGTEEVQGFADDSTWRVAVLTLWEIVWAVVDLVEGVRRVIPLHPTGGRCQFPADLLLNKEGIMLALKYGKDTADQWSVKEPFEIAKILNY